jgi:hypothetical protein
MFAPVEGKRFASVGLAASAASFVLLVAGCGGTRQDANEPSGNFHVSIVKASFPKRQVVAAPTALTVTIRNDDTRTVPNLAVTVTTTSASTGKAGVSTYGSYGSAPIGFNYVSTQPGLTNPLRPVWILDNVTIDNVPHNGVTAYDATWAIGSLAAGATRTFVWGLTPVKAGTWKVSYRVGAGLNGKAVAVLANGQPPAGTLPARISNVPPQSRVDPNTGRVIRSAPAVAPGTPPQAAGEGQ